MGGNDSLRLYEFLVTIARGLIGTATYKRTATFEEAPITVNCWTFVKWVYNQGGIWLPDYPMGQYEYGLCRSVSRGDLRPGDLIFTTGPNFSDHLHVGLANDEESVIHATNYRKKKGGVFEIPIEKLLSQKREFIGVRRPFA